MKPHVVRISIAPVKSLGLVHPDEIELGRDGVAGDRRFWLLDEDGRVFNNKRCGPMQLIQQKWDETTRTLALTFPNDERVEGVVELGAAAVGELWRAPIASHHVIGPRSEERRVGKEGRSRWSPYH